LKTGNGGNAGRQTINARRLQGKLDLKTCPGRGGQEAKNGVGGDGTRAHRFVTERFMPLLIYYYNYY